MQQENNFEYTDGIEIERCVTNNTSAVDEFLCPICHKIYYSPISCSKCENHFCRFCITEWQKKNSLKCPFSCEFKERPSSKLMNTLLSKLSIRCKNNDNGCNFVGPYEGIFKHEKTCEFKNFSCSYCKKAVNTDQKTKHLENECLLSMQNLIITLKEDVKKYKSEAEMEKSNRKELEEMLRKLKDNGVIDNNPRSNSLKVNSISQNSIFEEMNSQNNLTPEGKLKSFYEWMLTRGIKFKNIDIIFQENEFMVFAKDNLKKGDEILFIPKSQMIAYSQIEGSDSSKNLLKYTAFNGITVKNTQKLSLVIFLLSEKMKNNSSLAPYLNMYPHFNQQTSLSFDDNELHYLKGSALYEEIRVSKEEMKKDWQITRELLKSVKYSDFTSAYYTVFNKNFKVGQENDTNILPLLDFILPDVPENKQTILEYDKNLDGYRLIANKNILKNRRIFNSNLKFSNQELITNYGITFENNIFDTFEVYLFFNDFDPLINYKIEIFNNRDEPFTFKLRNSFALDNIGQFLSYLRLIESSDKNEIKKSFGFYTNHAININNEKKVFKKLELILKSKLKNYETDMNQDENLLKSNTLSLNQKHCVFVRYSEKKIISSFINFVEVVQNILNKTIVRSKMNSIEITEYLKSIENILL